MNAPPPPSSHARPGARAGLAAARILPVALRS